MADSDLEFAEELREDKEEKKEFSKVINKKKLNSFEMDELFLE